MVELLIAVVRARRMERGIRGVRKRLSEAMW